MRNTLQLLKGKTQSALKEQLGAVAFEYVLMIGGVSVVAVGLLAVGADLMMKQLLIYGLSVAVRVRGDILLGLATDPSLWMSVRFSHEDTSSLKAET